MFQQLGYSLLFLFNLIHELTIARTMQLADHGRRRVIIHVDAHVSHVTNRLCAGRITPHAGRVALRAGRPAGRICSRLLVLALRG